MTTKPTLEYTSLDQLDPILGPTSTAHKTSAPQSVVLAILAKGHRHQIPPKLIRAWIRSRLAPRKDVLAVSQSEAWNSLSTASREWLRSQDLRSSSSLAAAVARRGLARCLAEIKLVDTKTLKPLGGHAQVVARHTAAVLALEAIAGAWQGKETVMASHPWLAVKRGVQRLAAQRQFHQVVDLGWIKVVAGGRAGVPSRIRFTRLPGAVGAVVDGEVRYEQVGQIAGQAEPTDLLAAVFRSAAHPAWCYSPELSPTHWLVALADATAEVDPVNLGVKKTRLASIRKKLVEVLGAPAERTAESLTEALDAHAIEVGAFHTYDIAEAARREAAEERRQEVMAVRESKRQAAQEKEAVKMDAKLRKAEEKAALAGRETLDEQAARLVPRLYVKAGTLPTPPQGTAALKSWLTEGEPLLAKCPPPLRMVMANVLYADMLQIGWPENVAGAFAKAAAGPALQAA